MNDFLNALKKETNLTETENGAGAYSSTLNACLDAFGSLGAMRNSDEQTIIETFSKAFDEDRKLAMRLLFYMRDIRGGQGMRRVFRVILKWLANTHSDFVIYNMDNILKYGRGDDIFALFNTICEESMFVWVEKTLCDDLNNAVSDRPCSLLAKWMPSENTSSAQTRAYARKFMKALRWSPRHYRKVLAFLRNYIDVVEVKMSAREWDKVNYPTVPAKAASNYVNAFVAHDEERYTKYLTDLAEGNTKINAASLFPVDIVKKAMSKKDKANQLVADAMWKALPNYFGDKEETGICVVDVSGSMTGLPMQVAISLGMYCADKCKGPFKNHFITFSGNPQLVQIHGDTIGEKVDNMERSDWGYNTNLKAVFNLILNTAKKNNIQEKDMPKKLYIISDMQFDEAACSRDFYGRYQGEVSPFMDIMKKKYAEAGYAMPSIVYWNVRASDCGMFQTTFDGENCCVCSGYSPSLFKSIIDGTTYEEVKDGDTITVKQTLDPMTVMLTALNNERYDNVWCG